jgi:hypothetical protein
LRAWKWLLGEVMQLVVRVSLGGQKGKNPRGVPRDLHIQIAFLGVLFRSRATRHPERSFKRIQICESEARESAKNGRNCSGGCPRD